MNRFKNCINRNAQRYKVTEDDFAKATDHKYPYEQVTRSSNMGFVHLV